MIHHFHGTPIWGNEGSVHRIAVSGAGACVSHYRPDQLRASLQYAENVMLDNGAYSFWGKEEVPDWFKFYCDLEEFYDNPKLKFFIIPDVIVGGEEENDKLVRRVPKAFRGKAAPCWHLHESLERLAELCKSWERVCLGSSGEFAVIRTKAWHGRMREAFLTIADVGENNLIHGLRMLDGRVLGNYPLNTADSTNLACNVPKFKVKYPELTRQIIEADYCRGLSEKEKKATILRNRCAILKASIESVKPPTMEEWLVKEAP